MAAFFCAKHSEAAPSWQEGHAALSSSRPEKSCVDCATQEIPQLPQLTLLSAEHPFPPASDVAAESMNHAAGRREDASPTRLLGEGEEEEVGDAIRARRGHGRGRRSAQGLPV